VTFCRLLVRFVVHFQVESMWLGAAGVLCPLDWCR